MPEAINLTTGILGTYGAATIISDYDGPFDVFVKLRSKPAGKVFRCNVCLLPYIAIIPLVCFGFGLPGYLATIGGGLILARLT